MMGARQSGTGGASTNRAADWTDLYIEALLDERPALHRDRMVDRLDPRTREAAVALRRTLVRFHPSFRFEERLSASLQADSAKGISDAPWGRLIAFRQLGADTEAEPDRERRPRGYLVGGVIASGVSIASLCGAVVYRRRARWRTERSA